MPEKRYKPEEIVAKLRQVDVHLSQGISVADTIRQMGHSDFIHRLQGDRSLAGQDEAAMVGCVRQRRGLH